MCMLPHWHIVIRCQSIYDMYRHWYVWECCQWWCIHAVVTICVWLSEVIKMRVCCCNVVQHLVTCLLMFYCDRILLRCLEKLHSVIVCIHAPSISHANCIYYLTSQIWIYIVEKSRQHEYIFIECYFVIVDCSDSISVYSMTWFTHDYETCDCKCVLVSEYHKNEYICWWSFINREYIFVKLYLWL